MATAAIAAGADVINLPDTVGYTTPDEIREMFRYVIANAKGAENVIFSSHNHNDLGLAVANALAAVEGGARQIECTVNGIGERAGNTSLEEVVMAINTRADRYEYECGIITREIVPSSTLLSMITGLTIPFNKPIVGRNAFAHESGIHQHGMIANARTYAAAATWSWASIRDAPAWLSAALNWALTLRRSRWTSCMSGSSYWPTERRKYTPMTCVC